MILCLFDLEDLLIFLVFLVGLNFIFFG